MYQLKSQSGNHPVKSEHVNQIKSERTTLLNIMIMRVCFHETFSPLCDRAWRTPDCAQPKSKSQLTHKRA
jgi:hypothetical protein